MKLTKKIYPLLSILVKFIYRFCLWHKQTGNSLKNCTLKKEVVPNFSQKIGCQNLKGLYRGKTTFLKLRVH